MTRVLLVCEFATLNGGEHSLLAMLEPLGCEGFEFAAAAPGRGPLADELAAHGVDIFPLEFSDSPGVRRPLPALRESLSHIIRQTRPALVHANSLSMSRLIGPVAAAMTVPSIGHLRDIVTLSRQAITDINQLDRRLAVSEAVRSYHVGQGMNSDRSFVLYNGVDLRQFRPQRRTGWLHRELRLADSARLLGTMGQIALRKGHDVMAQALRQVVESPRAHEMDLHWIIVGQRHSDKAESRQFEASLHARASDGPLAGRVHFLGYRADMPAVYSELALLVHPARQEPLGRVLLEAAACGLPIVATDVGGTREIFPPALHAARLVPPNDADALAEAIMGTLGSAERLATLGAAARQRIVSAFDCCVAAQRLAQHYRQVVSWQADAPTPNP